MLLFPQMRNIKFFKKSSQNVNKGDTLTKKRASPLYDLTKSDLLVYTLVLVIKSIVFAALSVASEKVLHLVLIKA